MTPVEERGSADAPQPDAVALPDEDTLIIPTSLRAAVYPRRSGMPSPVDLNPDAVAVVQRHEEAIREVVPEMGPDATLVAAGSGYLRGEATPLGAAVAATVASWEAEIDQWHEIQLFADAWIHSHGLVFAAEAVAELARVHDHKSPSRTRFNYLRLRQADDKDWGIGTNECVAQRVRAFLALAEEREYQAAVSALGRHRETDFQRTVVSFLVPTEADWVEENCQAAARTDLPQVRWRLLLSSLGSARQLEVLATRDRDWNWLCHQEVLATLLDGVGAAALPALARIGDYNRSAVCSAIGAIPTDDAFALLVSWLDRPGVHRTVRDAMRRFPVRAFRVLAVASPGTSRAAMYAARLLRAHVRDNPQLLAAVRADPTSPVRTAIDRVDTRVSWVHEASPDAVPHLLAEPPWTRSRTPPKRVVVKNLRADSAADSADRAGAPRPPFSVEIARQTADWFTRLAPARPAALAWLHQHGERAAEALVPDALGMAGPARCCAETALRAIAEHRGVAAVVEVAGAYGDQASQAIATLLTHDPLDFFPDPLPDTGSWMDVDLLPQVLMRGRDAALPTGALRNLCTMLAMSSPGEVYAGVGMVRDQLDPVSLAALGWELFEHSGHAGWALHALAAIGDDDTARRLAPLIRSWPSEGGGGLGRALAGLDVLASIGSDVALTQLHSLATSMRGQRLRGGASERLDRVSAGLGLSAEELADRVVPRLGLDGTSDLILDYGPRRFHVGFDEQLRPHVLDTAGTRRRALPKPGAHDDPVLAPAAYRRFAGLRKDLRTVADVQIARLEQAMVTQRLWSVAEFRRLFVDHPILWHLVRRLLWRTGEGRLLRLAEDGSFSGAGGDRVDLSPSTLVGIAHPAQFPDARDGWAEVFDDYRICQPFAQLRRPVNALTDAERSGAELERFKDAAVSTSQVLDLLGRGWQRPARKDNGLELCVFRPVPGNRVVVVDLDPGIDADVLDHRPEQRLRRVWIGSDDEGDWRPFPQTTFEGLDPVIASEVLTDLVELTS